MGNAWRVVIPSDSAENLVRSVGSIFRTHGIKDPAEIIVVTRRVTGPAPGGPDGVTYVRDPVEKFNFARRVNLGLAAAGDLDVVLMSDDVEVVTQNAFNLMAEEAPLRLLAASVRGRVGPWWQREGQNQAEAPFVSFICVYIPRTVQRVIGALDEGFPGYGYEDTDYCLRARKKGLSCGVCGRVVVEHGIKIQSAFMNGFGGELPVMEGEARRAFLRKYGAVDAVPAETEAPAAAGDGA